ncbi:Uncharacterised protein [uncultured archaeon]|nr:Uncharacterised protein [uncultured archaeon]
MQARPRATSPRGQAAIRCELSNLNDQESAFLDASLYGFIAFRTIRRARWDKADWTWCAVFHALKSIDFPNQPFYLRPESWELVLHNIPDNFPVNAKIVMN